MDERRKIAHGKDFRFLDMRKMPKPFETLT